MKLLLALVLVTSLPLAPRNTAEAAAGSQLATPQLIQQAVDASQIDQATGYLYLAWALAGDDRLPTRFAGTLPWDGTLSALDLTEATATLPAGVTRTAIFDALRPQTRNVANTCGASSGGVNSYTTTHFVIDYGSIGGGLSIADYADALETTWGKEVTSFSWAAPPVKPSNPPPGNRYHVIVSPLSSGLYGVTYNYGTYAGSAGNNPNTAWSDGDAYATCIVMQSNYTGFPGTPLQAMEATSAHEFDHSIQFGYGALAGSNVPDDALIEGGATWMEDEVFDSANDNYNYLWPDFTGSMGAYTSSPYPYWITFRGITERYGTGIASGGEQVMQDFWEETSKNTGDNLTAMQTALGNKGTTLASAFHAYAISVKFNRSCGAGYVYPYCLEEGPSYVAAAGPTASQGSIASVGGSYNGSVRDDYALNWVTIPAGGTSYSLTLHNTSAGGQLRASTACDTGSGLIVTGFPSVVGSGSLTTLSSFDASGCSSAVVVITNQSQTSADPSYSSLRTYSLTTGSAGSSTLSVGDRSVTEGNTGTTTANFAVTLSPSSSSTVTVEYATSSGSATSGVDFQPASGALTFTPGQTSKTVPVLVNGDTLVEPDETFIVSLANASGATIGDDQGLGTILNDDGGGGGCTITGTTARDSLTGTSGDDVICGLGGNDVIRPGAGDDMIYGGPGYDYVGYDNMRSHVNAYLATGTVYEYFAGGGIDHVSGIEGVTGTSGPDSIHGNGGANGLYGFGGADFVYGLGGNDLLVGGPGADWLFGGKGTDDCRGGDGVDHESACEI